MTSILRGGLAAAVVAAVTAVAYTNTAQAAVFSFSGSLSPCAEVGPFGDGTNNSNVGPDGDPLTAFDNNPCGTSTHSGTFSATYDDISKVFDFSFEYTGLTNVPNGHPNFDGDPFSAWHIHLGDPGVNGVILVDGGNITPPANNSNPLSDSFVVTDALTSVVGLTVADFETVLKSGGFYINIHSDAYRQGELRAQILQVPEPTTLAVLAVGMIAFGAWRRHRA